LAILGVRALDAVGSTNLRAGPVGVEGWASREDRVALPGLDEDEDFVGMAFVGVDDCCCFDVPLVFAFLFSSSIALLISSTFGSMFLGVTGLLACAQQHRCRGTNRHGRTNTGQQTANKMIKLALRLSRFAFTRSMPRVREEIDDQGCIEVVREDVL
jgi:hypothetical protein